jgi:hypothetical protein
LFRHRLCFSGDVAARLRDRPPPTTPGTHGRSRWVGSGETRACGCGPKNSRCGEIWDGQVVAPAQRGRPATSGAALLARRTCAPETQFASFLGESAPARLLAPPPRRGRRAPEFPVVFPENGGPGHAGRRNASDCDSRSCVRTPGNAITVVAVSSLTSAGVIARRRSDKSAGIVRPNSSHVTCHMSFSLSPRRIYSLQRDAEIQRQVRLHVVVRLIAARGSKRCVSHVNQRRRR